MNFKSTRNFASRTWIFFFRLAFHGVAVGRRRSRRDGSSLAVALATVCVLFSASANGITSTMPPPPAILESDAIRIEVDPAHGTVLKIVDKKGGMELSSSAALADNFRLMILLPDGSKDIVNGKTQAAPTMAREPDSLSLRWNGPLVDSSGRPRDIALQLVAMLKDGHVSFRITMQNNSDCTVAEVWYLVAGGLEKFGAAKGPGQTFLTAPTPSPTTLKLTLPFEETAFPYPADYHPGQVNMSYISVYNTTANRALYCSAEDKVARYKKYRYLTLSAGSERSLFSCIEQFPYTRPGQSFTGADVRYQFHDGDYHQAGPIYREWFIKTFGIMKPSQDWIRQQTFFLFTMFILPEGNLNYTFKDIPLWAKSAYDHGVRAVQISGWNRGGHDNGYPYYTPDPRAGTYEDLRQGIAYCHELGMKVYFFVNYEPVMNDADWFKEELNQYIEEDPNGKPYLLNGFGMGTLWARMGHPKPMTWCDPAFPRFRDALVRQFKKLAEIGADGVHVDKMIPSILNFNPRCTMSPDTSTWQGVIDLTEMIMRECKKVNPNWCMSFETFWDRMLTYAGSTWWIGNMSMARTVFPELVETMSVCQPYDYLAVNNMVRQRLAILIGMQNFSKGMEWEPAEGLMDYIKEVKAIYDELADTVFFGQSLPQGEVVFAAKLAEGIDANSYVNLKNGKRACVLTNSRPMQITQTLSFFGKNGTGQVRIYTPYQKPRTASLPVELTVPGERIVFVEEL